MIKDVRKLNIAIADKEEIEQVYKDRLDFGFDSIYFRYACAIEELSRYKMGEKTNPHYNDKGYWDRWANDKKMHFYTTLEQLTHAHKI